MKYAPVAVIGAMDEEIAQLLPQLKDARTERHAGIDFAIGRFGQIKVIVCKSGVGKVNAAVCAQILIDRFRAASVIFTGVAGALAPQLNIGDIVISTELRHHDIDASALGFEPGTIPFAERSVFAADPALVELARNCADDIDGVNSHLGLVLSGDQFIADREKVKQLHERYGGLCTEMEGAAVAQVCAMNDIPFVVIRSMSDKADGSAPHNFAEFTVRAAEQSVRLVTAMIRHLQET